MDTLIWGWAASASYYCFILDWILLIASRVIFKKAFSSAPWHHAFILIVLFVAIVMIIIFTPYIFHCIVSGEFVSISEGLGDGGIAFVIFPILFGPALIGFCFAYMLNFIRRLLKHWKSN